MKILDINCWNPFSDVHKKAREHFLKLDLCSKIAVIAGTVLAAVATFYIGGLAGIGVFKALTDYFWSHLQEKNRKNQAEIFLKTVIDLPEDSVLLEIPADEGLIKNEQKNKELQSIFREFFFSSEKSNIRQGFDDQELVEIVKTIPELHGLIEELHKQGFRYCGDTNSDSKAYTDIEAKEIYIGKDKGAKEACLSLAYELTNAKNASRLKSVCSKYLKDSNPSNERAKLYADEILKIEAEAVFYRSIVAISLKLEGLIKNKKYLNIVRKGAENIINDIFLEMKQNGTVHNGMKKASSHYMEQYWQYNNTERQVMIYSQPMKFVLADIDM